ncbi:MAG: hypothetical protein ACU83O_05525, partial [Gammaproteobacteria bacterium]
GIIELEFTSGPKPIVFKREFVVFSNDKTNPEAKLSLQANIVLNITWEPKRLKLSLSDENGACPKITISCLDKIFK